MAADQAHIVVLGAGVIGLTIAHEIVERYPLYKVTVISRDFPDDAGLLSQSQASPWAGANWTAIGPYDELKHKLEKKTFEKLWSLIPTGFVQKLDSRWYFREQTELDTLWWRDIPRDLRKLTPSELPPGAADGVAFTTVSLNPLEYLPWLYHRIRSRGAHFVRKKVESVEDAAAFVHWRGAVVNATGLGARTLIGVEDGTVYPVRGQTILACVPGLTQFMSYPLEANGDDPTYMIPRPSPPGHVILGGTYQADNWDLSPNYDTARGIWARCAKIAPALLAPDARIISHNVGLRPARKAGPRIQKEVVYLPLKSDNIVRGLAVQKVRDVRVVHCYGFGPAGYQQSWGAAEETLGLLDEIFTRE
ncbi:nucleotide-binding domain-containing protein [Trametopsis cervina]|nr:nucleotide-binding domain-containing protein [Trametopsis cervina]